jgi:hypothetical protein
MKNELKKIYKTLSPEAKKRGVIFSSALSNEEVETEDDTIHEVLDSSPDKDRRINLLKRDSFFDGLYKYNIIRE